MGNGPPLQAVLAASGLQEGRRRVPGSPSPASGPRWPGPLPAPPPGGPPRAWALGPARPSALATLSPAPVNADFRDPEARGCRNLRAGGCSGELGELALGPSSVPASAPTPGFHFCFAHQQLAALSCACLSPLGVSALLQSVWPPSHPATLWSRGLTTGQEA